MKRQHPRLGLGRICWWLGYTRQAYYAQGQRRGRRAMQDAVILELVAEHRRRVGPRLGTRKLYGLIAADLSAAGIKCGRDRLFGLLRRAGLLVTASSARRPRTTDSSRWLRQWPDRRADLLADPRPTAPEQLWVADITYVRLAPSTAAAAGSPFCYLSLITDAYSRKIVGAYVSRGLHADGPLKALRQAIGQRRHPERDLAHHSDRGLQYCSGVYVRELQAAGIAISMTQDGCPYDNALAESVNGQLKSEYALSGEYGDVAAVRYAVAEAVRRYNDHRPHGSLRGRTPAEVHEDPVHQAGIDMAWGSLPEPTSQTRTTSPPPTTLSRTGDPQDNPHQDDHHRCQTEAGLLPPPVKYF